VKLVWDESAWADYVWWQAQDRKVLKPASPVIVQIVSIPGTTRFAPRRVPCCPGLLRTWAGYRRHRGALIAIAVTRVISALLAVPAFFLNAPAWAMIAGGFVIPATVTVLVLLRRLIVSTIPQAGRSSSRYVISPRLE